MMDILEKEWNKFKDIVIPEDAPDYQIKDMKQSFFAGIIVTANIMKKTNENEIAEMLDKLEDEVIEYLILNKLMD
jgi:hypothetical protein